MSFWTMRTLSENATHQLKSENPHEIRVSGRPDHT